tara:strand:- start:1347 stop:2222 length:876 start_codon:yes stop_codon:yes gene_type:complete
MAIRLLYGLTKEAIKRMKPAELDDVAIRLNATQGEQMGKKAQQQMMATSRAIDEEKGIRAIRDKEYGVMQDELRGASELMPKTGGIQSIARGDLENVPYPEALFKSGKNQYGQQSNWYTNPKTNDVYKLGKEGNKEVFEEVSSPALTPSFVRLGNKGDDVIPEFSSKNLAMKEMENGVPSGYTLSERAGYMGPRLSSEGNPLKLKDMTFGQLDEAQQGVYKIVKQSDIEELSDPGVLSDLLDYSRRAGRGRDPKAIVSEYWETRGAKIRDYMSSLQSGDVPAGTQMDLLLD